MPECPNWICCQIGAREHYAIPRALQSAGRLHALLTDIWCPPERRLAGLLHRRVRDRYHSDLRGSRVFSWNFSAAVLALRQRLNAQTSWATVIARNRWFQERALRRLELIHRANPGVQFVVFSYSYAAARLFEFAKRVGWSTVLGQIDPGPAEERIVSRLHAGAPQAHEFWQQAPPDYWRNWKTECALADHIVVNSEWAKDGLLSEGIPREKMRVVPLVAQIPRDYRDFARAYPDRFSAERPLRLLFLGQACLRKGIGLVIEAANRLKGRPVEIWIVGPVQIDRADVVANHPVLRWFGSVPRSGTGAFYRDADAFLFPTFSDGFGLTQLEAQAWRLPLIVSRFCGQVVKPDVNGIVLDPLSCDTLIDTIGRLLNDPGELERMSREARLAPEHQFEGLASRLSSVALAGYART